MRQFSPPHLAALAALVLACPACILFARRHPGTPTTILCRGLAALIIAAWAGEYLADVLTHIWTVRYDLPLQLTDAISVTTAFALWTRRQLLAELVYMWALSASLQATLTPDLAWNFPSVFYFTFFIYHEVAIIAGLMLVFGLRLYPRPGAWWRTFAATCAFAVCAGTADALIRGADYMFLAAKPTYGSLLNVLGPWPWYLVSVAAVAVAMLLLLQAIAGAVQRRDRPPPGAAGEIQPPSWRA
ncbi:MAG TPA: TIGR02206 family membrane protein [Solirubrobacteraceae bacterium]|nr:TIGR02206 family membrane protein [Solirubrobacteraceae bacterium]